jgi:hypothetical protein
MTASADKAKEIGGGKPRGGRVLQGMAIDLLGCKQGFVHHHGDSRFRIVDEREGRHRAGRHAEQFCEVLRLAEAEAPESKALGHHSQVDARVLLGDDSGPDASPCRREKGSWCGRRAGSHAGLVTARP